MRKTIRHSTRRLCCITLVAVLTSSLCIAQTNQDSVQAKGDLEQAINGLSSKKFSERQTAHKALVEAGTSSIEVVENAAKTEKAEVAKRCIEILTQIANEFRH